MTRLRALLGVVGVLIAFAAHPVAWERGWSKAPAVVIVGSERDPRIDAAIAAIDFWNRTFAEIGTPFRLGPVSRSTDTIPVEYLERLSAQVLRRGGPGPDVSEPVKRIAGDLVIALSDGDFVSFTGRLPSERKILVGIKSQWRYPLNLPNVTGNLIAHEIGHAIGLGHNDDPAMLMCGRPASCRPDAWQAREPRIFPLTDADRALLLKLYPPSWPSRD